MAIVREGDVFDVVRCVVEIDGYERQRWQIKKVIIKNMNVVFVVVVLNLELMLEAYFKTKRSLAYWNSREIRRRQFYLK